jgi:hypothetical protein
MLSLLTKGEAIETARLLFEKRQAEFDGFEVWGCGRALYQFPEDLKASA